MLRVNASVGFVLWVFLPLVPRDLPRLRDDVALNTASSRLPSGEWVWWLLATCGAVIWANVKPCTAFSSFVVNASASALDLHSCELLLAKCALSWQCYIPVKFQWDD
ncbi:hypothetical protein Nepgr_014754 [Nepenthes gracilis]|uniref:Uncharacterized protein n=1 Tax=Nepenthes gracilis TaxID=150966 RepID=A0AAD3XQ53_NEPGR|nr:hypothetical protein Nepgr_014754 [Nepenthes gracilis]